jgi:hypothetical protein
MELTRRNKERKTQDTWRSTVRMEAEHQGKSLPEIKSLRKNRIRWRAFIKALCLSEG